jgi:HKD family nuclease
VDTPSQYHPGLNQVERLADRFARSLENARRVHIGVAYAKSSGVASLLGAGLPPASRAVVGLGFGLTDPLAVEQLDAAGVTVRVVPDGPERSASAFHPKLYLVERPDQLTAFSASANLTGAGWTTNVEQYEELTFDDPSPGARLQRERFEQLWSLGHDLATVRRAGEWERYRQRAHDRRTLEREDRRRLLKLQAATGQLLGMLARGTTRTAPGYLAVTNDRWWELQLGLRDQTDLALFWRRNTNDFRALEPGGVMFHLVKDSVAAEELRAVRGFSTYSGTYEVEDAAQAFRRHGALLGVTTITELHERLRIEPGSAIGIIHVHELTEFERPVTLLELRDNGVAFARNIVSGRGLSLAEVATLFELGGLGVPDRQMLAAEGAEPYRPEP